MQTTTRTALSICSAVVPASLLCVVGLLAACGERPQAKAPPAQELSETSQNFGNYVIHFNALRTDALTPEIARSYGIQRSTNRVMLNVTLMHKQDGQGPSKAVDGTVVVGVHNLNGQTKSMEMRRIAEGEAIYYIGEVSISGTEILVFDINATPAGESAPLNVKLQREFYSG